MPTGIYERKTIHLRIREKYTISDSGCWEWTASKVNGYGQIGYQGKTWLAHRLTYTLYVSDIEPGLHLDHLCRSTKCVNPEHLEPVTPAENVARMPIVGGWQRNKTHCKYGHELSGHNLYVTPDGRRQCKTCIKEREAKRARKTRNQA